MCFFQSAFSLSLSFPPPSCPSSVRPRWRPTTERSSRRHTPICHSFAQHHRRARLQYPAFSFSKCLAQWHFISSPALCSRLQALQTLTNGGRALSTSLYFIHSRERRTDQVACRVIVDRYALPDGADPNACDPGKQTWCGGTWNTIRANLDYIQDAGFTASTFFAPSVYSVLVMMCRAVWISPVSQNYEGPRTPYGDPYHGYWISDATKLNSKFGTSDDLKALSDDLHNRGM